EYLEEYHGEGIQHIALHTADIYATVDRLRAAGVQLLDTPDTYYEMVGKRLPDHGEPLEELHKRRILIDGSPSGGLLLQIFTKTGLDYSVEQDWSAYTPEEHALYRRLFERQSKLVPRYACNEWIDAIAGLDSAREIPRFDKVSRQLKAKTGWEIVAVPGLIPDDAFFTH